MRLQRGKLALRKVLTDDMQQEIQAYTTLATAQEWEQTSLWCDLCGKHHLLGRKQPEKGSLYLKCPACSPGDEMLSKSDRLSVLKGMKAFKPAYTRLREWSHHYYRQVLRDGSGVCGTCGQRNPTRLNPPEETRELIWQNSKWIGRYDEHLLAITCPRCQSVNCITLEGLCLALPEGRDFSRLHPRIHQLPYRTIEFAGRPAIITRFESVTETASFEVISDYETYDVLKIYGGGK